MAGFVTRKAIFRDPETTFLNSFDRFGRLTSLALPILLVTILLGAIGLVAFPGFLFYVVYFLFAIANLFTIVPVTTAWKADKFYQMILAKTFEWCHFVNLVCNRICYHVIIYSRSSILSKPLTIFEKASL